MMYTLYRCNLSSVMLYMLALNINDVINFDYMEQPSLEVSNTIDLVASVDRALD